MLQPLDKTSLELQDTWLEEAESEEDTWLAEVELEELATSPADPTSNNPAMRPLLDTIDP